jgi:hypothetical protein
MLATLGELPAPPGWGYELADPVYFPAAKTQVRMI